MSERVTRLLPRLMEMLETVDLDSEPGEVISILRRIREMGGKGVFSGKRSAEPAPNLLVLQHPDHTVSLHLRGLGLLLRHVHHANLQSENAIRRMAAALVTPSERGVPAGDVLYLLAALRELLELKAPMMSAASPTQTSSHYTSPSYSDHARNSHVDALNAAMQAIYAMNARG